MDYDVFDPFIFQLSDLVDDKTEFIPLISSEDEEDMHSEEVPGEIPILPIRNTVLFPGVVIPINVGRDRSIELTNEAYKNELLLGVLAQNDQSVEDPQEKDLHRIGTVGRIVKQLKMPDGSTTVIIQGKRRFQLQELVQIDPYMQGKVEEMPEDRPPSSDQEFKALVDSMKDLSLTIIQKSPNIPSEASFSIKNIESPSLLVNFISSNMNAEVEEKQGLLEVSQMRGRAEKAMEHLNNEFQMLELKNDIQSKVKTDIDEQQREYFLQQQMKQIQEELGESPNEQDVKELQEKAAKQKWSKEVQETFEKELNKLRRMNPAGAEYSVQLNYLETLVELPWGVYTKDHFDLKKARRILDRDHYGLERVKERIIEHLAVLKLKQDMKAPIICLHGPPGVGKTSLGKSVAESLGREYTRMSLGGLKDESEVRGHRKTYIGAMPGRIIQNLKRSGTSNPLFVLDEVDKVGNDPMGDPSSALLEVLDPEQNHRFYDNYVEVEYDLSHILFIATANDVQQIHSALRDRMEVIEVNGYTVEEKVEIAKRHLIPKQLEENGLSKGELKFPKKVLEKLIEEHTDESGVRNLEKRISKLVRNRAMKKAQGESFEERFKVSELNSILGPAHAKDKYRDNNTAGVVTGLAWTPTGGDILFVESSLSKGEGKLNLTGNLGDVMKESATIAQEYLKSHSQELDIPNELFSNWNIHMHVPEGATPKDGPSAGITMLTALASLFTQRKVRKHMGMTGEITLRGRILPVGGIKEKILAAKRADIKDLVLPKENRKDVEDIDPRYIKGLRFHYCEDMMQAVHFALLQEKVPGAMDFA
ncbi:MAG: endopeptidase La [Flavobacteriales bacterium]